MGVIFTEGFDTYGTSSTPVGITRKWALGSTSFITVSSGRFAGYSLRFTFGTTLGFLVPAHQTLILGFAFMVESLPLAESRVIEFRENGNLGINLRMQTNGEWSIYFNTTHIATTSGKAIGTGAWATVELRVKVDNSAGEYELRINRETVLSATSIDTQPASNSYTDQIYLLASSVSGPIWRYDDLYVIDPSTGTPNDFLGDFRIQTVFPAADVAVDCTPSTGGDNFAMLDENPADSDTSYVEGDDGDSDLYSHGDSVDGSVVYAAIVNVVAKETDANPFDIAPTIKSGSTLEAGTPQAIGSATYVTRFHVFAQSPDTLSAWTPAELETVQFGLEIST